MRKKKKIRIYFFSLVLVIVLVMILVKQSFRITLIGDTDIYLNVNSDYFENGYKAYIFNNVYDEVVVTNNVDTSKIGVYQVTYAIEIFGLKPVSVIRNVHVVDSEKPVITLNGDNYIYLNEYGSYQELGYTALDNIDGNITSQVVVNSNINSNEIGKYEITYTVKDSSDNESIVKREVEVVQGGLLSSNVKDFWLKDSFDKVMLEYEEKEYDYFKDTVFLGDSNTYFLHTKGNYISANQTWGQNNLNIAQINASTFTTYADKKVRNLEQAISKFKPKYLIVSTGINAPLYMRKNDYISEVEKFINYMKSNHSDIQIVFSATFPITTGTLSLSLQKKINEYNYYLAELCYKNNVNFINFSDEIRKSDGYANGNYFDCVSDADCGFHLNSKGRAKYIEYIKHLNLERKVS